jgi:hypothetical protein
VCAADVQPHATAWLIVGSTACSTIFQHASCHACLLIINISEASQVQNHAKAYAAALLHLPAITHCPPKCIMHHRLHTLIAIFVHSALSKHNAVSTRQEQNTVLHCWMLRHAIMSLIAHNTIVNLCLTHVLPCPAPVHAHSSAIPWRPLLHHNSTR